MTWYLAFRSSEQYSPSTQERARINSCGEPNELYWYGLFREVPSLVELSTLATVIQIRGKLNIMLYHDHMVSIVWSIERARINSQMSRLSVCKIGRGLVTNVKIQYAKPTKLLQLNLFAGSRAGT